MIDGLNWASRMKAKTAGLTDEQWALVHDHHNHRERQEECQSCKLEEKVCCPTCDYWVFPWELVDKEELLPPRHGVTVRLISTGCSRC